MFKKDQVLVLRENWRDIECENGDYTHQLANIPKDTEYTVTRTRPDNTEWVSVEWENANGGLMSNCYDPHHFTLKTEPTKAPEGFERFPDGKTVSELGLRVGDKFIVVVADDFSVGEVVELVHDDNSWCPKFKSTVTGDVSYEFLRYLAPIKQTPEELAEENESLALQIDKLEARLVTVQLAAESLEPIKEQAEEMQAQADMLWGQVRKQEELEAEAAELEARIPKKKEFYRQNAETIKNSLPDDLKKLLKYA